MPPTATTPVTRRAALLNPLQLCRAWPDGSGPVVSVHDTTLATDRRLGFTLGFAGDVPPVSGEATHRVLSGLSVPWRVPTRRFGVPVQFTPETLRLPDDVTRVRLLVEHDAERPVGWVGRAEAMSRGLWLDMVLPLAAAAASGALTDHDLHLRDGLSIGVELDDETLTEIFDRLWDDDPDGPPVDLAGVVREVSLVAVPQYLDAHTDNTPAATVTPRPAATPDNRTDTPDGADRAAAGVSGLVTFATPTPEGSPAMPATATLPTAAPAPVIPGPAGTTPTAPAGPGTAPDGVALSLPDLAAQLRPFLGAGAGGPVHPAARWSSLGDLLIAAGDRTSGGARTDGGDRVAFVLADQITANNPGVLPPTWLSDVVGIIDRGRPAIAAFGGALGAGDTGMSLTWPYYDGDLEALVDVQAAQKTEVTTGRVDIKSNTANLATYAGASDISYQLLRRSSPSYREIYGRILSLAYAARTDKQFCTDITAAAVAGPTWDGATVDSLLAALFAASEQVDDAAGVPASVALAAPDVFALIGGGLGLLPPAYGTQNVGGTAQASTLTVEVSGLTIRKARHLAPSTFLMSTPEAAKWREDGPFPVEADDVAVLGRDVGIWGMGMTTVMVPAALVSVTVTTLPLTDSDTPDTPDRKSTTDKRK